MKRFCSLLIVVALMLTVVAGCNKGTKVHYEEERPIEQTKPVITGDEARASHSTLQVGKKGKVHYEEETVTESAPRPVITGD